MSPHLLKLRTRRFWRRRLALTAAAVQASNDSFERFGLARVGRLRPVWRFLVLWIGLVVAVAVALTLQIVGLKPYYQKLEPVAGGRFTEGVVGSFTTANPLYAISDVDTSVSRLVFASLLKYDDRDQLVGDLATSWTVNKLGNVYLVHLRPGLRWQDGRALTAADVAFTYQAIQNPDAQSPFYTSWHGIDVRALNASTVQFTLPNPLSSFPSSLTTGIVPKHILQSTDPVDWRSASFNTADPVGAGPFRWGSIGVSGVGDSALSQISLQPFAHYWAGKPQLTSFNVYAYASSSAMLQAYQNQEITAMVGLQTVPSSVASDHQSRLYSLPLLAGVYVFFRTDSAVFGDAMVRQALVLAANRQAIIAALGYPASVVDEPLLQGELAYDSSYAQRTDRLDRARALLQHAGWKRGPDGVWTRGKRELSFTLAVDDTSEYRRVARILQREWLAFGANVSLSVQAADDFQANLPSRNYDAVLYGIAIGADPDVFVYWDSSQADPRSATRLNFSDYHSVLSDLSLEAARTRLDQRLRVLKYHTFLQAWVHDAPALALYQPRLLYISHVTIYGLGSGGLNSDADRFQNVQNWMINTGWVTNP